MEEKECGGTLKKQVNKKFKERSLTPKAVIFTEEILCQKKVVFLHKRSIMVALRQQFIEDKQGNRIAVLMPIDQYNKLLDQLEDINDIRAYDAAKAEDDEIIPFDQAVNEIEKKEDCILIEEIQVDIES